MFLTTEDYLKIETWLKKRSVKDTEFSPAMKITGREQVAIIQNGKNVRCRIVDIVSATSDLKVENDSYINGSDITGLYNVDFIEILQLLDDDYRKRGIVVSYQNQAGEWKLMQYNADSISNLSWLDLNNWNDITSKQIEISAKYIAGFDNTGSSTKEGLLKMLDGKVKGNELITLSALNDYVKNMPFSNLPTDDKTILGSIEEIYDMIFEIEPAENVALTLDKYPLHVNLLPDSSIKSMDSLKDSDVVMIPIQRYHGDEDGTNYFNKETSNDGIVIPNATKTTAGVITAEDYAGLQDLFTKTFDVEIRNNSTPEKDEQSSTLPYIKKLDDNLYEFDNRWLNALQGNSVMTSLDSSGWKSSKLKTWGAISHSFPNILITYDVLQSYIATQKIIDKSTLDDYANNVDDRFNDLKDLIDDVKKHEYEYKEATVENLRNDTEHRDEFKELVLLDEILEDGYKPEIKSSGMITIVYKRTDTLHMNEIVGIVNYQFDIDVIVALSEIIELDTSATYTSQVNWVKVVARNVISLRSSKHNQQIMSGSNGSFDHNLTFNQYAWLDSLGKSHYCLTVKIPNNAFSADGPYSAYVKVSGVSDNKEFAKNLIKEFAYNESRKHAFIDYRP